MDLLQVKKESTEIINVPVPSFYKDGKFNYKVDADTLIVVASSPWDINISIHSKYSDSFDKNVCHAVTYTQTGEQEFKEAMNYAQEELKLFLESKQGIFIG